MASHLRKWCDFVLRRKTAPAEDPGNELLLDGAQRFLTPSQYEQLTASAAGAIQVAQDENPTARFAGIRACEDLWHLPDEPWFLGYVLEVVQHDIAPSVRTTACQILSHRLVNTQHPAAAQALAQIVLDGQQPVLLRAIAYGALLSVCLGNAASRSVVRFEFPIFFHEIEQQPLPDDVLYYVNWSLVRFYA